MTQKYKLAIAELVGVTVSGSTTGEDGKPRDFKFVLVCDRLKSDELRAVIADAAQTANTFFEQHVKGWREQDLVLDEAGAPASYSVPALQILFSIGGMAAVCWQAYLQQVMAAAKN